MAKKCIITKSSYNCSKYMKNVKMLGHSSIPPRGQGQFHNGNFAGTVSSKGFLKIFAYEFGTKSCLRVLQRFNIINKSTKMWPKNKIITFYAENCNNCMKNSFRGSSTVVTPRGSAQCWVWKIAKFCFCSLGNL